MTTLIPRPQYTERIAPFIGKNIIKVLTGQRRIGKSFILRQVMEEIRRKEPEAHIISINKELEQFRDIRTHEDLSHYLEPLLSKPGPHYLFIDEVQEIEGFQFCLRSLLADISTITRMDEASQLIQKERVVLNDLIAEVTADMELKPADQRLRVNIDFPQQVEIVGSPSLLASIFRNLADNAAAYSGGRDIFIRLLSDTPEECTVSFADNGIGIGEEHLPHIFERFYRIDKGRSRKLGGTGLGLAIVKNAVAIHGGTITARNRDRGGLEFVFTLKKQG